MKRSISILGIVSCLFVFGCSNLPSDLPRLYSCSVSVIQNEKPVKGAIVMLHRPDGEQKWFPMAETDENGVATMRTNGLYVGAPAGDYKMTVMINIFGDSKHGPPPPEGTPEYERWYDKVASEDRPVFSSVELKYLNPQTTPLTFEVKKQRANTTTIDVGNAVKIKI